jgi:hypothetical protein
MGVDEVAAEMEGTSTDCPDRMGGMVRQNVDSRKTVSVPRITALSIADQPLGELKE